MWWIIGAFGVLSVATILAACRVSGYESRREENSEDKDVRT